MTSPAPFITQYHAIIRKITQWYVNKMYILNNFFGNNYYNDNIGITNESPMENLYLNMLIFTEEITIFFILFHFDLNLKLNF